MPFQIIRDDITHVKADVIVNTANPEPVFSNGTDSAIYAAAGEHRLLKERKKIGRISPGEAAVTPAFKLPVKYIIHTVGPVWQGGNHGEFDILHSCYRKSLLLAKQLGCESIAFPLIATGVYGFPKEEALQIAIEEFKEFLNNEEMNITLVVFGRNSYKVADSILGKVEQYIDDHYVASATETEYGFRGTGRDDYRRSPDGSVENGSFRYHRERDTASAFLGKPHLLEQERQLRSRKPGSGIPGASKIEDTARLENPFISGTVPGSAEHEKEESFSKEKREAPELLSKSERASVPVFSAGNKRAVLGSKGKKAADLSEAVSKLGESFQKRLFRLIDEREMSDPEVYKKANIDRKLFSKIRCKEDYNPNKKTAIALAIALSLNEDDTADLLRSAGYALSNNNKSDVIIHFCIENEIYDIYQVNTLLFEFNQPILG